MSDLKGTDRTKIEKILEMSSGYVLNFSNGTFKDFILEYTDIDIYTEEYGLNGTSKASRLRSLWVKKDNYTVATLLFHLIEKWKTDQETYGIAIGERDQVLYEECLKIVEKLKKMSSGQHIDSIKPNSDDKDFHKLAESIREEIKKNKPEVAIDHLHTFIVRYIRELCDKHEINYDKNKPLHSLFGEYVNILSKKKLIDSTMTIRILKSSISVLESFSDVRNNQSFAHDNPILNNNESMLIFNNIASLIEFIKSIESFHNTPVKVELKGTFNQPFYTRIAMINKNEIFNLLSDSELGIENFDLTSAEDSHSLITTIVHKTSPFRFTIKNPLASYDLFEYSFTMFGPGYEMSQLYPDQGFTDFDEVRKEFKNWLNNHLKNYLDDQKEIDLWEVFKNNSKSLNIEKNDFNERDPISLDERIQLKLSINELKNLIQKGFETNATDQQLVVERLDYLSEAVDRLNRFDWKSVAVSTIIDISIALSLDAEQGHILFELFKKVFAVIPKLIGT